MRALESLGVDIAILTEAKLTGGIYTRGGRGYLVVATEAKSAWQGGVAICVRESSHYVVEETTKFGPNVMAFQLQTGSKRFYIIGAYVPPSDRTTIDQIRDAWKQCLGGCTPILLGDLNINLAQPRDERDEEIAEECGFMGLTDMSRHFRQPRKRRRCRGRWTWRMRRRGRDISSQADYLLAPEGNRREFRGVTLKAPWHHDSDHRAVIATIDATAAAAAAELKRYKRK